MALGGMMGPLLGGALMGDRGGIRRGPMLPAMLAGLQPRGPVGERMAAPGLAFGDALRGRMGRRPIRGRRPPIVGMLGDMMMGRRPAAGDMSGGFGGLL